MSAFWRINFHTKPVRQFSIIFGAVASLAAAPLVSASPAEAAAATAFVPSGQSVDDFYEVRQDKPVWFEGGQPTAAAQALLALLSTASVDGLDPQSYKPDEIRNALREASGGSKRDVRKADRLLSEEFAAYARDLRSFPTTALQYVDPALRLGPPSPLRILQIAARAPSLKQFVAGMEWMNPNYVQLRTALVTGKYADDKQRDLLRLNLERARILPSGQRYIIVNAASQRLYMYDDDKLVDSMKVVVGQVQPGRNTPMFASFINDAKLNPYWNVPPDLAWDDVGVHVKAYGLGYLNSRGFQILSTWDDDATEVDPKTIDWQAVQDGIVKLRIRQLPGPHNVLGAVKFDIPNQYGIYLHDTSQKELLKKDVRLYSGGCIRLEDAERLGEWLFGHRLQASSDDPDITIPLGKPVPVYVTYLTAVPNGSAVTFLDDVYGRDGERMASSQANGSGSTVAVR